MFCLRLSVCLLYPTTCTVVDKTRKQTTGKWIWHSDQHSSTYFITSTYECLRSTPHVQIVHADCLAKGTIC